MQYKNWTSWSNNFSLITELPSFYDRIKLAADISNFTFDLCSLVAMIQVQVSTLLGTVSCHQDSLYSK